MAEGQDLKGRVRTGTQPAADAAPDLLLQIRARGWWLPLRHASVCCGLGRWSEGPSGVAGAGVGRGWGRLGKRCGDEPCYFEGSGAPPPGLLRAAWPLLAPSTGCCPLPAIMHI